MTKDKFPALAQILGCYFHQDWTDEFDSDAIALEAIVRGEPKSQLCAAIHEIDDLLSGDYSESKLRQILTKEIGCNFEPAVKGRSYVDWLQYVRVTIGRENLRCN